jgi:hypothetical protein
VGLIGLALGLCLLNALKPLTIDDAVYYEYARHIAYHPLDPYGFTLGPGAESANEILAPAGFLYWWGAVYRLVGESPLGWKLGLAPLCLVLVFSLAELARRFAPGRELSLVSLIVLSPALLPGLNLMLDVPALALSLTATALFLRACDNRSLLQSLAAGLVAGLAMQTKYTAFVTPALFLTAGWLQRRFWLGLLAASLAVGLFAGWECLLAARYGQSHFLIAFQQRNGPLTARIQLLLPLVGILGGTAAAGTLLALAALGAPRRLAWLLAGLILAGYLLVLLVPQSHAILIPASKPCRSLLTVNSLVFGSLGLLGVGLAGIAIWQALRSAQDPAARQTTLLLLAWLALETAGYFALSPYPAVRRVLGVLVVGTLTVGAAACRHTDTRRLDTHFRLAVAVGVVVGLISFASDFDLYRLERQAARQAARWIHAPTRQPTVMWYQGTGSFQFYAAHLGMRRLDVHAARPAPGDWLIVPVLRYGIRAEGPVGDNHWREQGRFSLGSPLPLRSCYQWGGTVLEHHEGPLIEVAIYRREGTSG